MTTDGEQEKAQQSPELPKTPRPTSERQPSQRSFFGRNSASNVSNGQNADTGVEDSEEEKEAKPTRWSMGVLNDPATHEVPGENLY